MSLIYRTREGYDITRYSFQFHTKSVTDKQFLVENCRLRQI